MRLIIFFIAALCFGAALAQENCKGQELDNAIFTSAPILINTTANGKLYQQTDVDPPLNIVHVYGSSYEQGYAQGVLLQPMLSTLLPQTLTWLDQQINEAVPNLPPFVQHLLDTQGLTAVVEAYYHWTLPFTPQSYIDELQGMADGSGLELDLLWTVNLLPEIVRAHCSMMGSWGPAIANTTGTFYQLRALDWSTNGPFQEFPAVIVYHPDQGQAFANVAWTGFVGSLTGWSSARVAICEKVWLSYNGTYSPKGIPWTFLLRDILQYDLTIDSALTRIANADRTCSIYVGLGDDSINQMRIVQYSHDYIKIGDDKNFPSWSDHPNFESVVYLDKHKQPSTDPCFGSLVEKHYGSLDSVTTLQKITPVEQTGDMHIALFDFSKNWMYVSNCSPVENNDPSTVVPAYNRPFVRLDMDSLWNEPAPSS